MIFLDVILFVTKGLLYDHSKKVDEAFINLNKEGFALKLSKCEFSVKKISWIGTYIDKWL